MYYTFQSTVLPGIITAIAAYLLGSISFSIIFTRLYAGHADIRDMGSGNAGATNVMRSVGKRPAILTFLCDFLKCAISIAICREVFCYFGALSGFVETDLALLSWYGSYVAGISCLIGHIYPVYYGFRGGKGVVTCAAMVALIDWRAFVIEILIFIVLFAKTRMVSVGSIVALSLHPVVTFLVTFFLDYKTGMISKWGERPGIAYVVASTVFALISASLTVIKHLPNIKRILNGTESQLLF